MNRRFPWVALIAVPLVMVACGDDDGGSDPGTAGASGSSGSGARAGGGTGARSGAPAGGAPSPEGGSGDGGTENGTGAVGGGDAGTGGTTEYAGAGGTPPEESAGAGGTPDIDPGAGGADGGYAGASEGGTGGVPAEVVGGSGGEGGSVAAVVPSLENPSFEEDWTGGGWTITSAPTTGVWSIKEALGTQPKAAHDGTHYLDLYNAAAFTFSASQTLASVPEGDYTASVWVASGGPFTTLALQVSEYGGSPVSVSLSTSPWPPSQFTTASFHVTSGQVKVEIIADGPAAAWANIDDIALTPVTP